MLSSYAVIRKLINFCLLFIVSVTLLWTFTFSCHGYYWLHKRTLNGLAQDFLKNGQISNLSYGDEGSYEINGKIVSYDDYRFVDHDLVTFYQDRARADTGQQPCYYIYDYLKRRGIPEELFFTSGSLCRI